MWAICGIRESLEFLWNEDLSRGPPFFFPAASRMDRGGREEESALAPNSEGGKERERPVRWGHKPKKYIVFIVLTMFWRVKLKYFLKNKTHRSMIRDFQIFRPTICFPTSLLRPSSVTAAASLSKCFYPCQPPPPSLSSVQKTEFYAPRFGKRDKKRSGDFFHEKGQNYGALNREWFTTPDE